MGKEGTPKDSAKIDTEKTTRSSKVGSMDEYAARKEKERKEKDRLLAEDVENTKKAAMEAREAEGAAATAAYEASKAAERRGGNWWEDEEYKLAKKLHQEAELKAYLTAKAAREADIRAKGLPSWQDEGEKKGFFG